MILLADGGKLSVFLAKPADLLFRPSVLTLFFDFPHWLEQPPYSQPFQLGLQSIIQVYQSPQ